MVDIFVEGGCIEVCGFGSFFFYFCVFCVGCNFKIGVSVKLYGKYVFYFKFGKELCEWVNDFMFDVLFGFYGDDKCNVDDVFGEVVNG